jgi:hypothetical protein
MIKLLVYQDGFVRSCNTFLRSGTTLLWPGSAGDAVAAAAKGELLSSLSVAIE